jgi:hypothetical protein
LSGAPIPPLNAPPAGLVSAGVQPGVSSAVVLAHYVIVFGDLGGVFVYNGTPGPDTLLASVTDASRDPYGTPTQNGVTAYGSNGSYAQLSENGGTAILYLRPSGLVHPSIIPGITSGAGNPGEVNEYTYIELSSGSEAGTPLDQVVLNMFSAPNDGSAAAQVTLVFPNGQRMLFIEAGGFAPGNAIMTGNLAINNTNRSSGYPYACNGQTGYQDMSDSLPVPANDAQPNGVYRVTIAGNGAQGSTAEGIFVSLGIQTNVLDAPVNNVAVCELGGASIPASEDFGWRIVFDVVINTTGAAASYGVFASGSFEEFSSSNAQAVAGQNATGNVAFATTSNWWILIQAKFAAASTGNITSYYATLERLGP